MSISRSIFRKRRREMCRLACLVLPCAMTLGCEQGHSARWYMAHGDEMSRKVKECQADPARAANDHDCANAIEAFVTWARASGQK